MLNQKKLIHETDWDYLLLLDACRFDYFEDMFSQFLEGELIPVWSEGSQTYEWLSKTWPNKYDITYVSGHALINSKGIKGHTSLRRKAVEAGCEPNYMANEHFKEIVDVWDWGYSQAYETVPPWSVDDGIKGLETDKSVLAHYVQPHFPWLLGLKEIDHPGAKRKELKPVERNRMPRFSRGWIVEHLGIKGLEHAYKSNLGAVLGSVSILVPELEGKVIITSDHGLLLTEQGSSHEADLEEPILRNVPWLEIRDG